MHSVQKAMDTNCNLFKSDTSTDCVNVEDTLMSDVAKFYEGQTVLLTGGTGFVGKVVLEKLMRQCPGIKAFYLLVRSKRGVSAAERLRKLLQCPLFEVVIKKYPGVAKKLHLVDGEIQKTDLGLKQEDLAELGEKVTVVIHCAATIRFKDTLKATLMSNVVGTDRVLSLCHQIKGLVSFVHVSTAYSNCVVSEIFEKMYYHTDEVKRILELTEWMDEDMLETLAPKLLGKYPNYYTYSKALAEQLVASKAKELPVVIVRPSIVIMTMKDPFPGWVDSVNGPVGLIIALGTGLLQTLRMNLDLHPDTIPCDYVSNTIIVAAYHRAINSNCAGTVPIFNSVTGPRNPLTFREFQSMAMKLLLKNPSKRMLRYPRIHITKSPLVDNWRLFAYHKIPFTFLDFIMPLGGEKPFLTKLMGKVQNGLGVMRYFFDREWIFHNDQTRNLYFSLSSQDKQIFPMLNEGSKWEELIEVGYWGGRKHLLKDDPSSLPQARRKLTLLYGVSLFADAILYATFIYMLFCIVWFFFQNVL